MKGDMEDLVQFLLVPSSRVHLLMSLGKTTGYFGFGNCLPS